MKLVFFVSFSIIFSINIFSQKIEIYGNVIDKGNNPIEYSTVDLLSLPDSLHISRTMTNESGRFSIKIVNDNKANKYKLNIASYGFESISKEFSTNQTLDIGTFILNEIEQLDEVLVVAEKNQININGTEKSFDPGSNIFSKNGTAFDALSHIAGLWINREGELILNGKKGVTLMINGQEQILDKDALNAVLKSINVTSVKNIVVNTLPSAKNEASGAAGTIDIKIKDRKSNGFDSDISLSTHFRNQINLIGNLNFRLKSNKWYIGVGMGISKTSRLMDVSNIFLYRENALETDAAILQENEYRNKNIHSTIKYQVNDSNVIGLIFNGFNNKTDNPVISSTHVKPITPETLFFPDSLSVTNSINLERLKSDSYGLFWDYVSNNGNSLYFSTDYSSYDKDFDVNAQTFLSLFDTPDNIIKEEIIDFSIPFDVNIFSAKLDYSIPIKENYLLELGTKYSRTENDSGRTFSSSLDSNIEKSNFNYKENIFSLYTNYSGHKDYNRKYKQINYQIGLRLEHTNPLFSFSDSDLVPINDYTRLFPSLNLGFVFESNNTINIGYNRRIQRPLYNELSPFVFFLSDYISREGNPSLIPEDIHNFLLSYTFNKGKGNIEFNYSHSLDKITQMPFQNSENFNVILQNVNIQKRQNFSVTGIFQNKIVNWWNISNNISGIYDRYYQDNFEGSKLDINKISFSFDTTHEFLLSKNCNLQLSALYLSPFIDGLYETSNYFMASLGVEKSFFKNRLNLNMELQDIFNTYKDDVIVNFNSLQSKFVQKIDTRIFKVALSYNFKSGEKVKKASKEQSNESEKSRVN
ncbi:outer membrane beta-barrel family protein [Aquimarina agarivorans]|uniref:outer membrane beta-barrel family protein n=1 Tax=Aquimarina agarivorans TaxID=980584 RepID=UPI000248FC66|nr:outer membrane beta-barrel family protein [Aquimarina agarivorans]